MRRVASLALLALLAAPPAAGDPPAGPVPAGNTAGADAENSRNVSFRLPAIEYLRAEPCVRVGAVGDRSEWPAGTEVRWSPIVRWPPSPPWMREPVDPPVPPEFTLDGRPRAVVPEPKGTPWGYVPWVADPGPHVLLATYATDRCETRTDALRVLLLVERRTKEAGDRRFGSFVRRFRKSLDDLHALFAASVHPLSPEGVLDRFRIDDVRVYDRVEGQSPDGFDDHPEFDVAIACDEGGPLAGFSLPAYSIGHNFTGPPEHRGLWSSWGEQALWHELMHFRGVQDFYLYEVADGALPSRWKGKLPLPLRYATDLLASPYQAPLISEYAAAMANARRGVARVGACEDTDNRYGHVWNWLPGRVDLTVTKGGAPAAGATVRWWRGLPLPVEKGPPSQGVAAGRAPDGQAVADAAGKVAIAGDYLGRARPRDERSLWLLVEVEANGERRFEILYGLDLNLAYARGSKYVVPIAWRFEDLLVPEGAVPAGR